MNTNPCTIGILKVDGKLKDLHVVQNKGGTWTARSRIESREFHSRRHAVSWLKRLYKGVDVTWYE